MKVTTSKSKNSESFYITQSYINGNGKRTSKRIRKLGTLKSKDLIAVARINTGVTAIYSALPDKRLTRVFGVIDKSPLKLSTGAILCMAEQFSALDRNNLIVPIWMI